MEQSKMTSARKKKIKTVLSMMNKQNQRLIPIAQPLVEMMDLVTTDDELNYLLKMGTGLYNYEQALQASHMSDEKFQPLFDTMKRKGLVHIEYDNTGKELYRLNAIAVGWYEAMMHYIVGNPSEKAFSEKWSEFFKSFRKFNFFPMRNVQNLVMRPLVKPSQDTAIMDPGIEGETKSKTIPINTSLSVSDSTAYPTFYVSDLIEEYGNQDAIYAFPCVCRHGNSLLDSPCRFEMPKESCIAFGNMAKAWANWGYGRHVSKAEAIDILKEVRDKGAVHSVIHERDDYRLPVAAICNCCWDCCGILKPYNMGAAALKYKASYTARIRDDADCKGCGNCEKYCPTTAMKLVDKKVTLNSKKCIGCGQCAFQCRQNNIEL
ncbi:MAG: 4Fe-4S binding protein, partial [Deltaproteobacteria bacterium]|nr:4Fe-4S binding protein [Deltaproteobacteria bacterium]